MFEMMPEGRKRVDRNDAVRQTVPEVLWKKTTDSDSCWGSWWKHYKLMNVPPPPPWPSSTGTMTWWAANAPEKTQCTL